MNIYSRIAAILLPLVLLVDRFLYSLPDWFAISLALTAASLYAIGIYQDRKTVTSGKCTKK